MFLCWFIGSATTALANVRLALESDRDTYLLYEPVIFNLRIQNIGSETMALQDHPVTKRPWLSFLIFKADGNKVGATGSFSVPPQVLKQGESSVMEIDITPLYQIRESGRFDVQAVVSIPGKSTYQTGRLRIYVGRGEEVWRREINRNGVIRVYSLIRFLEKKNSSLYVRVEEPSQNLVYTTQRLGFMAGYTSPTVEFDAAGSMHVMHETAVRKYRYSIISLDGQMLDQQDRIAERDVPRLALSPEGNVVVAGGVNPSGKVKRRNLSEDQMGL